VITLDGKKASKIFDFRVRENEQKWFILGAFSVGLFLLGLVAGRIFTQSRSSIALLITVTWFSGSAQLSSDQGLTKPIHTASVNIEPSKIGTPTLIQWRLDGGLVGEKSTAFRTL